MHELSIAEHLIEAAQAAARAAGALRVVRLRLRLGALAGVDARALRFCFDVAAEGTLLGGAEFEIEEIAARARCRHCQSEAHLVDACIGVCGCCGSRQMYVTHGRELEITELEIEDGADPACAAAAAQEEQAVKSEVTR